MRRVDPMSAVWRVPGLGSGSAAAILGMDPHHSSNELKAALLMRLVHLEQAGPDWLAWRRQGVGASEAGAILGLNPWQSSEDVFAAKVGLAEEFAGNAHTQRGKRLEPAARQRYEQLMGWPMPPCCVLHDEYDFIRASLDGLRADGRLVLEIKCPTLRWHDEVKSHGVPDWYYAQIQHQLLVTEAPRCHFVSYNEDAERDLHLATVEADSHFQRHLLRELVAFWGRVQAYLRSVRPASARAA